MDLMQEHDDDLNRKVILLSVGSAAVAALLVVLARRREDEGVAARGRGGCRGREEDSKKAAKAAKKKRKELAAAATETRHHVADEVRDATEHLSADAKAAERDLKAAAWDAQQAAKEAENRLLAAGHRVVDDTTHLASWFGAEARNLAGEGKEKLAQLRHRRRTKARSSAKSNGSALRSASSRNTSGSPSRKRVKKHLAWPPGLPVRAGQARRQSRLRRRLAALGQIERALRAKLPALAGGQEQSPGRRDPAERAGIDTARHGRSGGRRCSRKVRLDARFSECRA